MESPINGRAKKNPTIGNMEIALRRKSIPIIIVNKAVTIRGPLSEASFSFGILSLLLQITG
jgi:hypothetical protein